LALPAEDGSEDENPGPLIHHLGLAGGASANCMVDTGNVADGQIESGAIKGHFLTRAVHFFVRRRGLRLPECVWDGDRYSHLIVTQAKDGNALGLSFLARHLVTFDFPGRTMYLLRRSIEPLPR
jgi:hypothetical protein